MISASEIRLGNAIRIDGQVSKVLAWEIKGTGKFGKTIHAKLRNFETGHIAEKSFRAEDKVEEVSLEHVKMQYLYKEDDQFIFMNMSDYEQFPIAAQTVGKQEVFLKENSEIDVLFAEGKPLSIAFPQAVPLKVTSAPPGTKGGSDSTYKEVELENGLTILAPQFIKEGDVVKVNVDELSYMERLPTKSL